MHAYTADYVDVYDIEDIYVHDIEDIFELDQDCFLPALTQAPQTNFSHNVVLVSY
jgi:hypothetical protein